MSGPEVLVVGAGPVGLTAAIELRRRGVGCRIVDALAEPPRYAKAVGIQPRTLEVFEGMGVLGRILDSAVQMRGQIVCVNGSEVMRIELALPEEVPFGFVGLPQYETERILTEHLTVLGTRVDRGTRLASFVEEGETVVATLVGPEGTESVRTPYLLGCDGAHSVVRKGLGLTFEGAAFAEQYMLGDVEVDWSLPRGYAIRSMHTTDGKTDDLLVCIPLPGRYRYRMSMLVPEDLETAGGGADAVEHGFVTEGGRAPELRHVQDVLNRLSPQPVRASNLRWSSVFRISHRIVDAYRRGRVFVAGDAAHIHPPTGAQGMNTGIQDAHNLAWKIALAVSGVASGSLLDSYDAERRPVGEDVVGRTVRNAREGIGAGEDDSNVVLLREAQLLIDYAQSPITGDGSGVVASGARAPDVRGLTRDAVAFPVRLFSVLRRDRHALLLYMDSSAPDRIQSAETVAAAAAAAGHGLLDTYLITASGLDAGGTVLTVMEDTAGEFATVYGAGDASVFVVRQDGYLGFRGDRMDAAAVTEYLSGTFG